MNRAALMRHHHLPFGGAGLPSAVKRVLVLGAAGPASVPPWPWLDSALR